MARTRKKSSSKSSYQFLFYFVIIFFVISLSIGFAAFGNSVATISYTPNSISSDLYKKRGL